MLHWLFALAFAIKTEFDFGWLMQNALLIARQTKYLIGLNYGSGTIKLERERERMTKREKRRKKEEELN